MCQQDGFARPCRGSHQSHLDTGLQAGIQNLHQAWAENLVWQAGRQSRFGGKERQAHGKIVLRVCEIFLIVPLMGEFLQRKILNLQGKHCRHNSIHP
jgi:hypothetical protein